MKVYDEQRLYERLSALDRVRLAGFSAACAQRFVPLLGNFGSGTGIANPEVIERVIDHVWTVVGGGGHLDLADDQYSAENQVPDEDDDWKYEFGYGQNAAACAAYATRSCLTGDPWEAVFAARQVYELADYVAQYTSPSPDHLAPEMERQVRGGGAVQRALADIDSYLNVVESPEVDWVNLRQRANDDGVELLSSLP